jgi:ABC-type phosphate transport system permease subunit
MSILKTFAEEDRRVIQNLEEKRKTLSSLMLTQKLSEDDYELARKALVSLDNQLFIRKVMVLGIEKSII